MNIRRILFSALVTAGIGAVVGLGVAHIVTPRYQSQFYQTLPRRYPLFGAGTGFIYGACLEAIRQQKAQRDREEEG